MSQVPHTMDHCCFQGCGYQLNPRETPHTLPAGQACAPYKGCDIAGAGEAACLLATAFIADQPYIAGYCACEAHVQGTLFPELVRPYLP